MSISEPFHNEVGLRKEKLDVLLEGFSKLGTRDGSLYQRVLRYVLDGEDDVCLSALSAVPDAAHAVGLWPSVDWDGAPNRHASLDPFRMASESAWPAFFA